MRKSTVGTRAALLPNPPAASWLIGGFYNSRVNAVGEAAKNFELDSGVKWAQTSFRMNNKMGRLVQTTRYWLFIRCPPNVRTLVQYSTNPQNFVQYLHHTLLNLTKLIFFFQIKGYHFTNLCLRIFLILWWSWGLRQSRCNSEIWFAKIRFKGRMLIYLGNSVE
jgi:hypothetical protein